TVSALDNTQRSSRRQSVQHRFGVNVFLEERPDRADSRCRHILVRREQAKVSLWNPDRRIFRQPTEDRRIRDSIRQNAVMAGAGKPVEYHSGNFYRRIERSKTVHQGGCAASHRVRIDDKDNRQIEPLRHLGGTASLGLAVEAVKQSHYALDDSYFES